jgi:hypothetical protein
MIPARLIGVMLALLTAAAGCTTGNPGPGAPLAGRAAPVTVEPAQIFNDVPQGP